MSKYYIFSMKQRDNISALMFGCQFLPGCFMSNEKNLTDGTWCCPDPILVWRREAACVFSQDADSPVWVPEYLVCAVDFPV